MARTPQVRLKRVFKDSAEIMHDAFKLKTEKVAKNQSYTKQIRLEYFDHNHIFHSVDSSGIPMMISSEVAGHFHKVEISNKNTDSVPEIISVSPAMRWVLRKNELTGNFEKVMEEVPWDSHTHETQYLFSEQFKPKKLNPEFAKLQGEIAQKEASLKVPGIIEA